MYVIEIWDDSAGKYWVAKTVKVRVNKIDHDGLSVLFQGVNYWQEGDDER